MIELLLILAGACFAAFAIGWICEPLFDVVEQWWARRRHSRCRVECRHGSCALEGDRYEDAF